MGPGTAEVNVYSSLMSAAAPDTNLCRDAFMSRFPVHRACRDGDVGALVSLSEQLSTRDHLTAEDPCYGWTPLHWAAHCGQLECVARLVQMGCEVNAVTSRFEQTPAHAAAFGGHPHCVAWLTQAGADVNMQDFVGEAPIHQAARSGSLECIQVLLIAGAKAHVRNASGQTAAELARARGFLDCFRLLSNAQRHLLQASGVPGGRKRPPAAADCGHGKIARRADAADVWVPSSGGGEEMESMNTDSAQEPDSDGDTGGIGGGRASPAAAPEGPASASPPPPANQRAPARNSPADTCGSLHWSGSPSSCVSQRASWWGLMGAECGDFQHYGHYHGFGDTAEELGQAEHRYKQAAATDTVHFYHGS